MDVSFARGMLVFAYLLVFAQKYVQALMRKLLSNLQSVDAAEKRKAEDEGTEDNKKVIKDKEEAEKNPRRHIQMKT